MGGAVRKDVHFFEEADTEVDAVSSISDEMVHDL